MKIAVIDRGLETSHRRLSKLVASGVTISQNVDEIRYLEGEFDDDDGHGTAVSTIIHRINPEAEIVSVKLKAHDDVITEDLLAKGIAYCADRSDISVVNISMGLASGNPGPGLVDAVEKAIDNGKYIVAACFPFLKKKCFPASLPKVFGVGTGLVHSKSDYKFVGTGDVNILAKGTTQRVAWKDDSFKISAGTSYATAHFSGLLSKELETIESPTYDKVVARIMAGSNEGVEELNFIRDHEVNEIGSDDDISKDLDFDQFTAYHEISFAKKLAIFPTNEKENKAVIEHTELDITLFIDYPRSFGKVNGFVIDESKLKNRLIKRFPEEEEFELFDTLVVGYYMDQLFDANVLFGNKLLRSCIERNKNFIVWDKAVLSYINRTIDRINPAYSGHVWSPFINADTVKKVQDLQYLPAVKVPVLGVVGTGSKQGKITTQIQLRKILRNEGYKVAHLSTEPQGALLGSEFAFPFGFKSTVGFSQMHWPVFLDALMRAIQKANDPHLIITGIQGGLVPRFPVNPKKTYLFSALNYISSVRPDVVVCAINPTDKIEVIQRNIETLNLYVNCKVLFYTITPWYRDFINSDNKFVSNYSMLNEEELKLKIEEYSEALDAPVVNVMDETQHGRILEIIQKSLS